MPTATQGDDTLIGTSANDFLDGLGGNDFLDGLDGNDTIAGGAGDDTILGGYGNDVLSGGLGSDLVFGGAGDDTLSSVESYDPDSPGSYQPQNDTLIGGAGNDVFIVNHWIESGVTYRGGDGFDTLQLVPGVVTKFDSLILDSVASIENVDAHELHGGDGDSQFNLSGVDIFVQGSSSYLGKGDDSYIGSQMADLVYGGWDNDHLFGAAGDDTLYGGLGNDLIEGGLGNDLLIGGEYGDGHNPVEGDTLIGGIGDDTLRIEARYTGAQTVLIGGYGHDTFQVWRYGEHRFSYLMLDEAASIETVHLANSHLDGTIGNDTLNVSGVIEFIQGNGSPVPENHGFRANLYSGDDHVVGSNLNDRIEGGSGNDTIVGLAGDDQFHGGLGNDSLLGGLGDDRLIGNEDDDYLSGGAGGDELYGNDGNDTLDGGEGDDTLDGGEGDDTLGGGEGDDYLTGGSGNDQITSSSGSDIVRGLAGNDVIHLTGTTYHTSGYVALNLSSDTQVGTQARINLEGLIRIEAVIDGGADADIVQLSEEGDAFFLHDAYSGFHSHLTLIEDYVGNPSNARFANIEEIRGMGGDDVIDLTSPEYSLAGSEMSIDGGEGNDVIWGSDANENISGGNGNDTIFGGIGTDVLSGGLGADVFEFTRTSTDTSVTDFDIGEGDMLRFYNTGGAEFDASSVVLTANGISISYTDTASGTDHDISIALATSAAEFSITLPEIFYALEFI